MPRGVRSIPDQLVTSLDDLVGDLSPFDPTDSSWRFFSGDELVDALTVERPEPRKRMGRPPKPHGAPRSGYTKGPAWQAAAQEGRFSRGECRVGVRWRRPDYADPRWDERPRKK